MAALKMYILRKTQKLKSIKILYFTTIFQHFVLEIETDWATRMFKIMLETRNVNDDPR